MKRDALIGSRIAGGNSAYGRKESDYYPTPSDATEALLLELKLPRSTRIWEPACGEGHMASVFAAQGHAVIATDVLFQGYGTGGIDFLNCEVPECDWVITNPPFALASKFIERCVGIGNPFALLLKSQYWHSKSRLSLFQAAPPALVLPLTWRPDFLFKTRGHGSPLMDCLWCVWIPGSTSTLYRPVARPQKEGE